MYLRVPVPHKYCMEHQMHCTQTYHVSTVSQYNIPKCKLLPRIQYYIFHGRKISFHFILTLPICIYEFLFVNSPKTSWVLRNNVTSPRTERNWVTSNVTTPLYTKDTKHSYWFTYNGRHDNGQHPSFLIGQDDVTSCNLSLL